MRYPCPCGREFRTQSALREHWEDYHPGKVARLKDIKARARAQIEKEQHADQLRWARLSGRTIPEPKAKHVSKQFRPEVEDYEMPETLVQRIRREMEEERRLREQSRSGPVEIEEE